MMRILFRAYGHGWHWSSSKNVKERNKRSGNLGGWPVVCGLAPNVYYHPGHVEQNTVETNRIRKIS